MIDRLENISKVRNLSGGFIKNLLEKEKLEGIC